MLGDRTGYAMLGVGMLLMSACALTRSPDLHAVDRRVDIVRFMGDWYVLASIPIDFPFFSEAGAHNGLESYVLRDDGVIETTYTYRDGGFDGKLRTLSPTAFVHDAETNAEWRMQFLWPFRAAYLIAYVDDEYTRTIIGVPNRAHAWIMARTPSLPEHEYTALVAEMERLGYDVNKLREVPQCWPEFGCARAD
jgi:apolipoprotein D and lipocalin family protein